MNINEISFKAVEAAKLMDCTGCMFLHERSGICYEAGAIAIAKGMPDCDERNQSGKTCIYVPDDSPQIAIDGRGEVVG